MRGRDEYVFSFAVPGLLLDVHSLLHFNDSMDDKNEYSNIQWGHSDPKCADFKQSNEGFYNWMTRDGKKYIYIDGKIKAKGQFLKKVVAVDKSGYAFTVLKIKYSWRASIISFIRFKCNK